MTSTQRILYKELYKKSLYDFVKDFWACCCPDPLVDGVLLQYYCEVFQYFCKDWVPIDEPEIIIPKEYYSYKIVDVRGTKKNLCINVPPRHSKSMVFNVMGPVWLWITTPVKCASISHTFDLSKKMNSLRQLLINSEKFKFFFGDEFELVSNTMDSLLDNRGGELYSKNRDSMTGYGADIIINDDLTNAQVAAKDRQEMLNAWNYYQNTMPSRINNINKCAIINIQQRLAPNDITGHILNDAKLRATYCFVVLPAIFDEDTLVVCPISGDLIIFNKGDSLWAERYGDYEAMALQVGDSVFQTQYLQKPVASDRIIVGKELIESVDVVDAPSMDQAQFVYASHDFPVKDKETSDFLGSLIGYRVGSILYIFDALEERQAFTKSVQYVKDLSMAYPGIIQIIEDKANGSPILQQLQTVILGLQTYQPGTKSKVQRLESSTVYMKTGNVKFVKTRFNKLLQEYEYSEGITNLIQKLLAFPFVEHDDVVDAFSQLVNFVFMDKVFQVYGRAFNEFNLVDYNTYTQNKKTYKTMFFNKSGDLWKVNEIVIVYGVESKIIVTKDWQFQASALDGINTLKEIAPGINMFVDCSAVPTLYGTYLKGLSIEKYDIEDFSLSVDALNLAFGKKQVLVDYTCKRTQADIENFKYDKNKNEDIKVFKTDEDGFCANLRIALKYYGI